MATTTRKSKSSKPAAAKRLSDEELVAYVGKALAKDPQVSMAAIVTAIRTSRVLPPAHAQAEDQARGSLSVVQRVGA